MQAIIYVRVSSGEQIAGTSLDSQEEQCRRYCADREIGVLLVFREEGESAKTADRTELLRALAYCRANKGRVQAFVVLRVDRFARNTEDHFYVRQLLQRSGVTLHSVTEPIGNRPTEKFVETVLAAGAEFDNAIRKQRSADGMVSRLRQGIMPWRPPVGYLCARHRKQGTKKTTADLPDPVAFPIIQRGLQAYLNGEVKTLRDFALRLDGWGLAQHRGKKCAKQLADHILGSYLPYYSGRLVNPWDGATYPGAHQPMISVEEAARIRQIRAGRVKPWAVRKDRFNPSFPLRRIVRCATCARSYTGGKSRGHGGLYPYYFCGNRSCAERGKTVRRHTLHEAFGRLMQSVVPTSAAWVALENAIRAGVEHWNTSIGQSNEVNDKRLSDLEAKRRTIFGLREDGTYSSDDFRERLGTVDADIAALKSVVPVDEPRAMDLPAALGAARRYFNQIRDHWTQLLPRNRSRFEQLVFPKGVEYDRTCGIRTPLLGPLLALVSSDVERLSPMVPLEGHRLNSILDTLAEIEKIEKETLEAQRLGTQEEPGLMDWAA